MLCIILDELSCDIKLPTCILGDVNADPADIPSLLDLLENEGWTDCGAKASIWGGTDNQHTCQAPNTTKSTRRDYAFVNDLLLPAVTSFQVEQSDVFPTHQPIFLEVDVEALGQPSTNFCKPQSAAKKFEQIIETSVKNNTNEKLNENTIRKELKEELHAYMKDQLEL